MSAAATLSDRFWSKVNKTDGCWIWTAAISPYGYGVFAITSNDTHLAHRVAYRLTVGEVPDGKMLDHICRNRSCVRIDHLRVVTSAQNCQNSGVHRDNRSGHRGVSWYKRDKKWRVRVMKDGQDYVGGMFDDLEEAAEAARALRNSLMTHNDIDRVAAA